MEPQRGTTVHRRGLSQLEVEQTINLTSEHIRIALFIYNRVAISVRFRNEDLHILEKAIRLSRTLMPTDGHRLAGIIARDTGESYYKVVVIAGSIQMVSITEHSSRALRVVGTEIDALESAITEFRLQSRHEPRLEEREIGNA